LNSKDIRILREDKKGETYRMNRLEHFPGFTVNKKSKQIQFNPFEGVKEPSRDIQERKSKFNNVLEANTIETKEEIVKIEEINGEPLLELFPRTKEVVPIPPSEPSVPMIQPRSVDGQRMLYRYPEIPKVGPRGCYWLLVGTEDRSESAWLVQFDGAANPNPGPASSGAVLWSPKDLDGKRSIVFESGKFLGKATNNIAEAQGLLLALQIAAARGAREILIEGDSELIIYQNIRKYKVSDKNLKVWWSTSQAAMMDETSFDWIAIRQVPREQNERADSITKEVLVRKQNFVR
jgi:ribonuclease HI